MTFGKNILSNFCFSSKIRLLVLALPKIRSKIEKEKILYILLYHKLQLTM